MTLAQNVTALATAVGGELKETRVLLNGNSDTLSALTTTAKGNLVAAINEVKTIADAAAGGGVAINDAVTNTTATWSSQKSTDYIATQVATKPSINDAAAATTSVYSSTKTDTLLATKPIINDTTPSTTAVFSSSKTNTAIAAAVAGLVNSAPAALDTLGELATALGTGTVAESIATALGNRVRFDASQTLTGPQKTQALANIGAPAVADLTTTNTNVSNLTTTVTTLSTNVGTTTTDFAAAFTAALA